jgi:hypothetical protein
VLIKQEGSKASSRQGVKENQKAKIKSQKPVNCLLFDLCFLLFAF